MLKLLVAAAAMILIVSDALADSITVTNHTDSTIYSLYAWPSELAAHTFNLLGFPLSPGSSEDIEVDTSYGACIYTFETNPNDPADKKKPKKYFSPRKNIEIRDINICLTLGRINLLPEADRL
ncbi:hypothetical protein ACQZ4Y_20020 [Rhizobium sp. L80/93]|uniref:hypothetical protein n=1 Tax=unclassified Rhizobium TaxID=2613769 RepID=UPI001ADA6193|nr:MULTISPECIES: hypothetical protein [unclassified Rhizobium]MBO9136773.1 hypothetical protein [Rhizobium sp. B209b/85]MBO9188006.1 hypothetical protein [Rhizobium sp. E27B/91]QXZ99082.1 hypothetical protein J5289_21550 [Rhizobium sp. B230/85]